MIGIAKPFIGDEEKAAVQEVLDSGQLVQGAWVERLENDFKAKIGVRHAVATSNGTTALTAALLAHGVGPGDEVIIPSFSFFATASCVLAVRATPVFADVDPKTFNMTVEAAEAKVTARTRAVMPVHLYGQPAEMEGFSRLCQERGLALLEDAAQAHLARIGDRCVGTFGTASFSFYPSKNMTTGEGGMVTTEDDEVARKLRMIRNQGMNTQYVHEIVGSNYRMTNLCAAIGVPQVARLDSWTTQREANASYLSKHLSSVTVPFVQPGCRHVFHQYTVLAPEGADRNAIVARLNERGIGARVYYPLAIHQQPIMKELGFSNVELPVTSGLVKRVFSLPVHPFLSEEELATIVREVNQSC